MVPDFIFGQNLEHTRACVAGGISAQILRNRKFAGKPSRNGVALDWQGGGDNVFYELVQSGYTRHAARNRMFPQNEINSQFKGEVKVDYSKKMNGGFKVAPKDGGYVLQFTDEEFTQLIANYLRPATKKILFG